MPMRVVLTLPQLDLAPGPAVMQELGDLAIRQIRARTEAGRAVDGGTFEPLSPSYAKVKQAELGHDRADLTVSGRMLHDMAVIATTPTTATLGFTSQGGRAPRGRQTLIQRSRAVGAQDKAFWHHVAGAGRRRVRRPFFGISRPDEAKLRAIAERWVRQLIAQLRSR